MSHPISVTCPACRVQGPVPAGMQGSAIACRRCGTRFSVAAPTPDTPAHVEEFVLPSSTTAIPTLPTVDIPRACAAPPTTESTTARRPVRENTLLEQYELICLWSAVVIGVVAFLLGIQLPVQPGMIFQFSFCLGMGIFSAGCTFAPEHVLCHPRIAAVIGTSNPTVARAVCAVVAVLMAVFCIVAVIAMHRG